MPIIIVLGSVPDQRATGRVRWRGHIKKECLQHLWVLLNDSKHNNKIVSNNLLSVVVR